MFKPATWYNLSGKSDVSVYLWYKRQFRQLSKPQIFMWQVEPGTIGEKAQADALGITRKQLLAIKEIHEGSKLLSWTRSLKDLAPSLLAACKI